MAETITIGLDIAKHVFQVHGVDASGAVVMRRRLRRSEVTGFFGALEPCGPSATSTPPAERRECRPCVRYAP